MIDRERKRDLKMKNLIVALSLFIVGCSSEKVSPILIIEPASIQQESDCPVQDEKTEEDPEINQPVPVQPEPDTIAVPEVIPADFCLDTCAKRVECNPKGFGIESCLRDCDVNKWTGEDIRLVRQDWVEEVVSCFESASCGSVNDGYRDIGMKSCEEKASAKLEPTDTARKLCHELELRCGHGGPEISCVEKVRLFSDKLLSSALNGTYDSCHIMERHVEKVLGLNPIEKLNEMEMSERGALLLRERCSSILVRTPRR
jgi:hypothetical protein